VPTAPLARETVPKLALFAKPKPARQYHVACRVTTRSLQFAQPGNPAFPRSYSLPSGATLFAHHVMPIGRGWTNREYAYLAEAFMENIGESNIRHGPDKSGLQGGTVQVLHGEEHVVKSRDSRAEQHICDCVRYPRWISSKFASNFSATVCGVICGSRGLRERCCRAPGSMETYSPTHGHILQRQRTDHWRVLPTVPAARNTYSL
jgi:hypothetical protein